MYIDLMKFENKNLYISSWLMLITFLIVLMIIVGGFTRLTDSGLSITKWDLITGILPPLTSESWEYYFSLYKKIPEFKLINSSMTINEFKTIYWWEYGHRLLGRIIGIAYLIPLLIFTVKKMLKKNELVNFFTILFLIIIQGFVGWYMVKSGLVEKTDVSHYRLSLHLSIAFFIFILLLWNLLNYQKYRILLTGKKISSILLFCFLIGIFLQIITGAFVSGLDAGKIYQTWPLMNQSYFPDDAAISELLSVSSFNEPSIVQFIHRNIAYLVFFLFLVIGKLILFNREHNCLRKNMFIVFGALLLQIILGIFTVLSGSQIIIASMHQIGSIILVTATVLLIYKNFKLTNVF